MLARHDEHVGWRFGIDVPKRHDVLVLEDDLRGNLLTHDSAEEAGVGHGCYRKWARRMANAAMPAVSNLRTLEPSDTRRHPARANCVRSSSVRPPSGPSATRAGVLADTFRSAMRSPPASRRRLIPLNPRSAARATSSATSSDDDGSQAPPLCSSAAI